MKNIMSKLTTSLGLCVFILCGCSSDNEEIPMNNNHNNEAKSYYLNDGKSVKEVSVENLFPWLNTKEKVIALKGIDKDFDIRKSRSTGTNDRKVVSYGYQSIIKSTKPHKAGFTDAFLKDMGLPRGIYMISEHTVKQTFGCTPNKEITPYPGYLNSTFKYKMGMKNERFSLERGFTTNLPNSVTTSDKFEATTVLIKIHSNIWGQTGFKEWWPCSPEELVWIYRERDNTFDWGVE